MVPELIEVAQPITVRILAGIRDVWARVAEVRHSVFVAVRRILKLTEALLERALDLDSVFWRELRELLATGLEWWRSGDQ